MSNYSDASELFYEVKRRASYRLFVRDFMDAGLKARNFLYLLGSRSSSLNITF